MVRSPKNPVNIRVVFVLCPREESNLYYEIRNLASYPLNDEGFAWIVYRRSADFKTR